MMTRLFLLIVCVTVSLSGCAGRADISISPAQVERLKDVQEIRILYAPLLTFNHLIRVSRGSGKYASFHEVHVDHLPLEDPLAGVQSQFVSGLTKNLGLRNIRKAERVEPHFEPLHSMEELSADRGVVFQFDTQNWQVIQQSLAHTSLAGTTLPARYLLKYSAKGRLFHNRETNLLWKALCDVSLNFEAPVDILLEKELADENSLLHGKRKEAETRCAEELLKKFLP